MKSSLTLIYGSRVAFFGGSLRLLNMERSRQGSMVLYRTRLPGSSWEEVFDQTPTCRAAVIHSMIFYHRTGLAGSKSELSRFPEESLRKESPSLRQYDHAEALILWHSLAHSLRHLSRRKTLYRKGSRAIPSTCSASGSHLGAGAPSLYLRASLNRGMAIFCRSPVRLECNV